ncbi:uroporphyrinogen-III synthase [Phyllobacterium sp. 21LDTY02-6]|jgi:uroporphyrinogen-III synthase|uniref:uroporphyrinogen-III synthase n=1 Tax=Phyllobacterium sp. 21LDTY02-6 TaxID=2944903 RepID=UPI002020D588|nr:uroporphyrinogen-III synthase [Phyllobacterium sp. 21LDTY02-6]MCO4317421.1 uroporphyrinogen-III synthase [Phyllobacterium sp. 21LDTY02-6]
MLKTVLVTRPEPGATRTAERLQRRGYQPIVLPLTSIEAIACELPGLDFDAVAVTSANALRHAPPDMLARLTHLPLFAVGEATADEGRKAGFGTVTEGAGDGEQLAAVLREELPRGARIAYLTGRVRTAEFERLVMAGERQMIAVELYDTKFITYQENDIRSIFKDIVLDFCLVYSAKGGEALVELVRRAAGPFSNTKFLCLSEKIATILNANGLTKIGVANRPQEEALLRLIEG